MSPLEFYEITEKKLKQLADIYEIENLEEYYELTDYNKKMPTSNYEDLSQVFAQLAFHGQNGAQIGNTVNFNANIVTLDNELCKFNPGEFLEKYNLTDINKDNKEDNQIRIEDASETLSIRLCKALHRKANNPHLPRYAKTLLYSAIYVHSFKNKKEIIEDLKKNYLKENYKDEEELIDYFREQIPAGFGVALACDFLKEFDNSFDLPKPDTHLMNTLNAFGINCKKEYECINEMKNLTENINKSLKDEEKLTVYKFDRMIYLVCSQNFFLDKKDRNSIKKIYLEKIRS